MSPHLAFTEQHVASGEYLPFAQLHEPALISAVDKWFECCLRKDVSCLIGLSSPKTPGVEREDRREWEDYFREFAIVSYTPVGFDRGDDGQVWVFARVRVARGRDCTDDVWTESWRLFPNGWRVTPRKSIFLR